MPDGEPYVVAAYLVFLLLVLVYVAIMALRLSRLERDLGAMHRATESADADAGAPAGADGAPEPVSSPA